MLWVGSEKLWLDDQIIESNKKIIIFYLKITKM